MQRGYPVRRRQAVVADLPLVGQLRHREKLVFDSAEIACLDLVVSPDSSRRQTTGSNPATDRLGVPPDIFSAASATDSIWRIVGVDADPSRRTTRESRGRAEPGADLSAAARRLRTPPFAGDPEMPLSKPSFAPFHSFPPIGCVRAKDREFRTVEPDSRYAGVRNPAKGDAANTG